MAKKSSKPPERKPRTDAQRNRERILEVAKGAFTRRGANASLDDIAKEAGVGAGTLYRHFPSRDALIEAVYRTEVERLAAAQRKFAETMPPIEALRAWMFLFVDYIAAKHIIAPALNTFVGGAAKLYEGSRAQIQGAIDALVTDESACDADGAGEPGSQVVGVGNGSKKNCRDPEDRGAGEKKRDAPLHHSCGRLRAQRSGT